MYNSTNAGSRENDGQTPLLWAAGNGNVEVVKLLLVRDGVEPNSEDKWNRTPWALTLDGQVLDAYFVRDFSFK